MVVGAGDRAEVYTSADLVDWSKAGDIGPFEGFPAGAFEVPDLFPLVDDDGVERWVFKTDILPGFASQGQTRVLIGDFDGATFTPATAPAPVDGGPDFYAAQVVARAAS